MLSLRGRMAAVALSASAAALLSLLVFVGPGLRREATGAVRDVLLAEARLLTRVVEEPLARGVSSDELDRLVDAAARDVRARATVVAPDGRVLADSSLADRHLTAVFHGESADQVLHVIGLALGTVMERRGDTVTVRANPPAAR